MDGGRSATRRALRLPQGRNRLALRQRQDFGQMRGRRLDPRLGLERRDFLQTQPGDQISERLVLH